MTGEADAGFEDLLAFLQQSRGFDFGGYKRPSLLRRVSRRLQMLGIDIRLRGNGLSGQVRELAGAGVRRAA